MNQPILIACAHGTDNPQGRLEISELRRQISQLRPGVDVREAYVDVQSPSLPEVVAALPPGTPAVIVPLLLSVGYHVEVDIAEAAAGRPRTVAAAPLGPDARLAELLAQRLDELPGFGPDWGVVLAAAGSSRPGAAAAVEILAEQLRELLPYTVLIGYGAGAEPRVPAAVSQLRDSLPPGAKVAVASYLLAPGFFHDRLAEAGADAVTGPLLPAPLLAELAIERFDAAAAVLRGEADAS
ncbi:sirohydrochlorin chelatase [Psychromicrobium lacuslunae]|uniref:Cobalamin biosynthesis protein CbiX n=1 Tax=Psychromicrobium lacuslunae TaxID=1618207 RepID=A0A0D4C0C4_9MICC|nr:CbiX/SirB N-terminal domain-containing protein [Psychromicrobium lacuslunae]AJT41870.1 cobalamin biosynthesis protein CbiX [Psychromicrobium lacuslunae]